MNAIKISPSPIETERLILRKLIGGDEISLFHEYCSDVEASKYLQRLPHTQIEQTKRLFENWSGVKWENGESEFVWIISDKKTHVAMGLVMFILKDGVVKSYGEIHFGLGRKFQGQGFMQEAITAVVSYFKENSSLKRIETFCDIEHVKSQNALLKSGFSKKELLNNWAVFPALGNEARDCVSFEIEIN